MGISKKTTKKLEDWLEKRALAIWANLQTNNLWQRMLKNTLATTIAVILALTPAVVRVYGKAAYLMPMTTVFGHPGRRFGMMAEALALAITGTLLGLAWSLFGVYLSSLVYHKNPPAAYTIKGFFLTVALLFHGFLRSHSPRLFLFVLLLIIVSVVSLTGIYVAVARASATTLLYPILTASAISFVVNVLVFPEFSSSLLGITTIETLGETVSALRGAGKYFIDVAGRPDKSAKTEETREMPEVAKAATMAEKPTEKLKISDNPVIQKLLNIFREAKDDTETKVNTGPQTVKLKDLTDAKAKLRSKLASCKDAQQECNFELAYAVLPPRDLKPISVTQMRQLVANTISLIGACESKYALMGDEDDKDRETKDEHQLKEVAEKADVGTGNESSRPSTGVDDSHDDSDYQKYLKKYKNKSKGRKKSKTRLARDRKDLELVKPRKEIEFGDIDLLKHLVNRIAGPISDLQEKVDRSVDVVTSCMAYCYDVPKLPSGARPPTGVELEEIDIRVDILTDAIEDFDKNSASALEGAAALDDLEHAQVDIMPRMETFLISSFLLNLRQAALHTLEMLRHSRVIVEKRQARHSRRRLYAPRINWRKWLSTGGEGDMLSLPATGRKDVRSGKKDDLPDDDSSTTSKKPLIKKDIESNHPETSPSTPAKVNKKPRVKKPDKGTLTHRLRNGLADVIEYLAGSEDVIYAIKIAVASFLVLWPAFVHRWNQWYYLNRGVWAALQLVLITEVSLGTSISVFMLRAFGTTIGCVWGYVAYQAGHGNRVICVIVLVIGIIPSTYIALGSKYVKAGMVCIISMCIVALATIDQVVPGTPTENFLKRLIAFLIGGIVALIVEVVLFPVKARDRLVESLAASLNQLTEMEACLAYGIEGETNNVDVHSKSVSERFERAKSKAEGALTAAETFLPFCANEPRLKGSFEGLALIYAEILYVLHAIGDRMDNMLHLRQEYGSGVLEELNEQVYPYRRNVAGSITLILFAVHEALTTKVPLPQFLPSARLAHLRMVNRVREVVLAKAPTQSDEAHRSEIEMKMIKRVVRQKFLSWNAASAGQIEVIEYLEELIDLAKLLVGANEFRSGLLTRPTYRQLVDGMGRQRKDADTMSQKQRDDEQNELMDIVTKPVKAPLRKRRTTVSKSNGQSGVPLEQKKTAEEELPRSLQRVRTRRVVERNLQLEKSRSKEKGKSH